MSATTQPETGECAECGGDREIHDSVKGSFCSRDCYHKHKGGKAFNIVKNDHRICSTCFRFVKSVESPQQKWIDEQKSREQFALNNGAVYHNNSGSAILDITECPDEQRTQRESVRGYQYRTENAVATVKEVPGPGKWDRTFRTATGCECGNAHTHEEYHPLREGEAWEILNNFVVMFHRLYDEAKIDKKLDRHMFLKTFLDTRDFDLAVGRGLYE